MKTKNILRLLSWLCLIVTSTIASAGLVLLDDKELGQQTGQALFMMDKTSRATGADTYTFYKMGLDAVMDINTNIKKLQLGCGGVNGVGCDIDIDHLSLSGPENCTGGRANCSAQLTRPFVEFAVKNDGVKTQREIIGYRFSAENAKGLMTLGDQQAGAGDPGNTLGINSLSGYMKLGATSGNALVQPRPMTYNNYTCQSGDGCTGTYAGLFRNMEGRIRITGMPLGIGNGTHDFLSDSYGLLVWSNDPAVVSVPSTVVSGSRMTSVALNGTATMGLLNFSGQMTANVDIGINLSLDKTVTGSISGLTATVPIQQSLKFIHKINVNSPFSLSMQKTNVLWPGASVGAQRGWWMAFEDEIDIGSISPEDKVAITNQVLLDALGPTAISWTPNPVPQGQRPNCVQGPSINCALHTAISTATYTSNNVTYHEVYGVECNGASACLGGSLPVGNLNVPANLPFPLQNLKLSGQSVVPNCWGSSRFC